MEMNTALLNLTDLSALCRRMVQTPSVNGRHPEKAMAALIAETAAGWGLEAELAALDPERPNVLVHAGPPGETALLLIGHLDTVPAGDEQTWSHPPFGGEITGGRLYGRGAVDTKGGMAAALAALRLLQDHHGTALTQRITFVGVPDEESGATGRLGVTHLQRIGKLSGRGAIYVYPDMHRINIGHRGVWRFRLTARGRSLHSGSLEWQQAPKGGNALTGLAEILLRLEALHLHGEDGSPFFAGLETILTPTVLNAGVGQSVVPDVAEAVVDVRLVPAVPKARVAGAVRQIVDAVCAARPPLAVELETLIDLPATLIPAETEHVVQLQRAAEGTTGLRPALVVSGPANESYLLNGMGIPTCTFGPSGGGAHAADEYVEVESLRMAAAIYALTALHLVKK